MYYYLIEIFGNIISHKNFSKKSDYLKALLILPSINKLNKL